MVRARAVVAQDFRARRPDEQRAIVGEPRRDRVRVAQLELEVLGSDGVARGDALVHARHDDRASVSQRRPCHAGGRQIAQLAGELPLHALDQCGIGGQEHGHGVGVVLGLGEQVCRDRGGVGARVREHDQLGRTREHVDRHRSGDEPLRRGHVAVPGSDDHVARRDGTRTVGERRDRLRPSHGQHAVRACDCGGGER